MAKTHSDPYLHQELNQRYFLTQLLGEGTMGRVYLAQDRLLGDVEVAVKLLSQALPESYFHQRFEQEAMACAALGQQSLHIVRVNDYGVSAEGLPFYVMEYLRGQTLRELLRRRQLLSLSQFLNLAWQMTLGLKVAHEGVSLRGQKVQVIHRDLKPANIMVLPNDSLGELVKIVDFGIAKLLEENGHASITQHYAGTLSYSSPEQLEGLRLDHRSDLYSLGVIFYQMVSGRLPLIPSTDSFAGWYHAHQTQQPNPFEIAIPPALQQLIVTCLAKDPAQRPPNAAAILTVLEQLRDPNLALAICPPTPVLTPIHPSDPTVVHRPVWLPPPLHRKLWIGAAGVVGSLALALGLYSATVTLLSPRSSPPPPSPYEAAITQAQVALAAAQYPTAIRSFQAALVQQPEDRLALSGLNKAQRLYQASLATPTPSPPPTPKPTPPPVVRRTVSTPRPRPALTPSSIVIPRRVVLPRLVAPSTPVREKLQIIRPSK